MSTAASVVAVILVALTSLGVGAFGLRISRTMSDFYVASRVVGPVLNASAISGEYLSAASFLGVAGLILARGVDMLWLPVGWTAGYLLLLVFVAAPLRRSGAYTLPDFAQLRVESSKARHVASLLVVGIGMLYLIPQFQGAGLTLRTLTGAPLWVGQVVVAIIVSLNVLPGGMRSVTLVQAFHYWLKLAALLTPIFFLLGAFVTGGAPAAVGRLDAVDWAEPLTGDYALYLTYSLVLATFLGTMGLPHVVVRFYTNPDGRAARRTTLVVLALLGAFYLLPVAYGILGRVLASDLVSSGRADSVVLELPGRLFSGVLADLLTALIAAGAFAAFLSTSMGLVVSVAGVLSQDVLRRRTELGHGVSAFRLATLIAVGLALGLTFVAARVPVAHAVELAFAVAASTFCPMLVLGIWWRRLTAVGVIAGLVVGGSLSMTAVLTTMMGIDADGLLGAILTQPAAITVPAAFATMIGASIATRHRQPPHVAQTMVRLHAPEHLTLNRGPFNPEAQLQARPDRLTARR
ncbi:cation acetate symporter [Intrasporangium calvum]|uniref:Cation acetate symporter n=1 Tax=Intrasporangium calvum TaxID=53358 RepID=A0ABT5GKC8_9MICO|nr:cation acetate symporter [Intrasporangium calvum]MDC5698674.1 cation acetate symporter [Intrasporangium calvum]